MAILPIRLYPDPVLRSRCRTVERFDDALATLVRDMVETMHAAPGIGLAANQVGIEDRVAVVDLSVGENAEDLLVLVNPEIEVEEGAELDVEGCLSIPGLTERVPRATRIRIRTQDATGTHFVVEAEGLLARAILHEMDHLDGVLFVDRLRGLRRERARRFLRRLGGQTEATA